jgi:NAD(P)H-dependent FMN reductase
VTILPVLAVVICSTRPGRVGLALGRWFCAVASELDLFEARLVDLVEVGLPLFDEPHHPRLGEYQHEHTRRWSRQVEEADAFVFVMPEYNHLPPPAFINALDFLSREWAYKAAGFVSYGGVSGGLRAVQVAKQMLGALRMTAAADAVVVPNVAQRIQVDGSFAPEAVHSDSVLTLLRELHRLTSALNPRRGLATPTSTR